MAKEFEQLIIEKARTFNADEGSKKTSFSKRQFKKGKEEAQDDDKVLKVGNIIEVKYIGRNSFDNFLETIIKPAIEKKHNMKFQKSNVSAISRIGRCMTKYGIRDIRNIFVEIINPSISISEDIIDCYAFRVQGNIKPKMPLNDCGANGDKEFELILRVNKFQKGTKMLLSSSIQVLADTMQESKNDLMESILRARQLEIDGLKHPYQGGSPGLGKNS